MSHSLIGADRSTHFKIVAVALVSAIVLVMVGVTARVPASRATAPFSRPASPRPSPLGMVRPSADFLDDLQPLNYAPMPGRVIFCGA